MIKRMYKAIAALAAYAAATLSGCAAKPMYDFGKGRGIFRLENKAKPSDRLTACGRVELRGTPDNPTDIEGFVARGIVNYAIKNGWHLVGNYVAKPGGDIPLVGAGYGRKIGDNTFVRAQVKLPVSDDGTLELEGLLVYDRERASALLLVRGYPENGTMTVEASLQGKLGRNKPIIELQASGEPSDLEVKLLAGWGFVF